MSNLFTEVSVEQQEVVSGGSNEIFDNVSTYLSTSSDTVAFKFDVASTKQGSAVSQTLLANKEYFDTGAYKNFAFYPGYYIY
jgi:hypothetical protein